MRDHGYEAEAEYVRTIAEWHEASDGRGLTQEERSHANNKMLRYLLTDWMPYHQEYDLSYIDVNR